MSSKENWVLKIDPGVFKTLKKLPRKDSERLIFIIEALASNPFSGDIQKLEGEENVWRRRIGAYRIFYEIYSFEKIILVFRLERRTTKTYKI